MQRELARTASAREEAERAQAAAESAARASTAQAREASAAALGTSKLSQSDTALLRAGEHVVEALDSYASWKSNLNLLRTYVDDAVEAVEEGGDVAGAIESVGELLTIVLAEAGEFRRDLKNLQDSLTG